MGETVQLLPDTEETEGHGVQSAALAGGLRKHPGTSNPYEDHAGFGEDGDNSGFSPLQEFTV